MNSLIGTLVVPQNRLFYVQEISNDGLAVKCLSFDTENRECVAWYKLADLKTVDVNSVKPLA